MKNFLLSCAFSLLCISSSFAQYPLVSIHDLQYIDAPSLAIGVDTSIYYLDTVQVEGIVTFDPCDYGLSTTGGRVGTWLQDGAGGAFNGVHVLIDAAAIGYTPGLNTLNNDVQFIDNFQVGNKVKCTGIVSNFGLTGAPVPGNSQILLLPVASSITGIGQAVPTPPLLTINQFSQNDGTGGQIIQRTTGEQWEGTYVQFNNVQVVDISYGTGSSTGRVFWSIQDQSGNKIQIRDVSGWMRNDTSDNFCTSSGSNTPTAWDVAPYANATISFVKGQIVEYCSTTSGCNYAVSPRDFNDIGVITAAPPIITNVNLSNPVPSTSETQTVSANITDVDGSVTSATLYYSVGLGNATFSSVAMSGSGSIWSGTIPAITTDSVYVNYWIKALDNGGNHANYPDSLATGSFYWVNNSGINSIKDVQWNPTGNGTPVYANKTLSDIDVEGIVMSTTGFLDLGLVTIQDGEGPWHGIFMRGQNLSTLQRGDKIKVTKAKIYENFNVTYLDSTTYTVVSTGNTLYNAYGGLSTESVRLGVFDETEPYEGSLVGFDVVYVVNQNPDNPSTFGEWSVDANTTDNLGMRCDDYSNDIGFDFGLDSLSLNQNLGYIYGIMYYSFSNWKILPRNKNDIEGYQTLTGIGNDPHHQLNGVKLYPNPATDQFDVAFDLKQAENLTIELVDVSGKLIKQLNSNYKSGFNQVNIAANTLLNGIYFLHIKGDGFSYATKLVIAK
ncbi:MAG: T9SS type A sorting domain-containing protein [Chitinophagaceae bacterium]|nr:T9SS type A sorting domain-containing protein [Chitinophagaceae bacterium]